MTAVRRAFVGTATVIAIAACASASVPVQNYQAVPIAAKTNPSLDQIGKAIVSGSSAAGWQANEVRPGVIVATYKIRQHFAIVDIAYTNNAYNITFKEGDPGLKFDGSTIHQNYNGWVNNLEKVIRAHVNAL
jgi:hypothetical protein